MIQIIYHKSWCNNTNEDVYGVSFDIYKEKNDIVDFPVSLYDTGCKIGRNLLPKNSIFVGSEDLNHGIDTNYGILRCIDEWKEDHDCVEHFIDLPTNLYKYKIDKLNLYGDKNHD